MPSDIDSSQPLLNSSEPTSSSSSSSKTSSLRTCYRQSRQAIKAFLSSPAQHYTVLTLVSLDLLGIFADIIINLYQCDEGDFAGPKWNDVREGLSIAGLVFSVLFMVELVMSVWAFGWRFVAYFSFYISMQLHLILYPSSLKSSL
jgi:hypothetical protein